ncbi:hypothetical protein ABAC460_16780 [Asticcacaulis sp. AC460]|uniref:hypothetical protein n=1 Tax=Asticcacaulis sp. AC460 TaxID=1282360 RepID=UPI0003C412A4|nr:hypothetical protein [Asticcacaulis sp. AC460]ESQ88315.1 hypothetical protein ABAC460_16780 [Asticcacaulis sp. AC460]
MSENVFYAAFFFPAAAGVLIFFMKYVSEILQARVRLAQDEAYRALAAQAIAAQTDAAKTLSTYGDTLTAIQTKLAAVEKVLKDVE